MNNTLKYILMGALVFVLVFLVALPFFGAGVPGAFGCGWNGSGTAWGMGPGMMRGGWGFHGMPVGFGWFGGLAMLGMFLRPLLFWGLIAAGVYWLIKNVTKQNQEQQK